MRFKFDLYDIAPALVNDLSRNRLYEESISTRRLIALFVENHVSKNSLECLVLACARILVASRAKV